MVRKVESKTQNEIASEWDALASLRYRQIISGDDISYSRVIVPTLLEMLPKAPIPRALDAGCGTGFFTSKLCSIANHVSGVDPSALSINLAKQTCPKNADFFVETLEDFSQKHPTKFDVVTANMVLMDTLDLDGFLHCCAKLLLPNGQLLFSITHPCFWPTYYGYSKLDWFQYEKEIAVEAPFRITANYNNPLPSTHVHRPLSRYLNSLSRFGFQLEDVREPVPPPDVSFEYKHRWQQPRYLLGSARIKA